MTLGTKRTGTRLPRGKSGLTPEEEAPSAFAGSAVSSGAASSPPSASSEAICVGVTPQHENGELSPFLFSSITHSRLNDSDK